MLKEQSIVNSFIEMERKKMSKISVLGAGTWGTDRKSVV